MGVAAVAGSVVLATALTGLALLDAGALATVTPQVMGRALELLAAGLVLLLTGVAVSALAGWHRLAANPALALGVGQCYLALWFCARSLLARAADMGGLHLPGCGTGELLVVALLTVVAARRCWPRLPRRELGVLAPLVLAGIAIAALRELPRVVSLSSDPDQHAFWALQLAKWGVIPWTQGDWGPLDFQYPAGFALMARLWMLGGSLTGVEAVMVQPLIQSFLSVMALTVWMAREFVAGASEPESSVESRSLQLLPAALLAGVAFYALLPYSLTKPYLRLQKTGSISSLMLLLTVAALLLEFRRAAGAGSRRRVAAALGAVLAFAALVNPVAALIPVAVSGAVLLGWPGRLGRLTVQEFLWGAGAFLVTLLADPYYFNRFLMQGAPPPPDLPPAFQEVRAAPGVEYLQYLRQYVFKLEWLRPWEMVPFVAHAPIARLVIGATVFVLWRAQAGARRGWLRAYLALPLGVTVLCLLLLPVFHLLRHRGDLYLLEPYLRQSAERVAYLWFFASVMLLGLALLARWPAQGQGRRPWAACALLLLLFVPAAALRDRLPTEIRIDARQDYCGESLCDFRDDLQLLQQIAPMLAQQPPGQPRPRVLVPNQRVDIWRERWIFPVGFTRALPDHLDQPLAFFYSKGDANFSYRNYVEHVCERFDRDWLKAHRVAYLFVPSDRRGACVAGLDELIAGPGVVARAGRAVFIRL